MRRVQGHRVIRLPDVPEQPDPYGWLLRMQALAELRALNEDPPQAKGLPDRRSPAHRPGGAPHRVGENPAASEEGPSPTETARRSGPSSPPP